MFGLRLPILFRRKPKVEVEKPLDHFAEDQCKIDGAVLVLLEMAHTYDVPGMKEMTLHVANTIGNKLLQRGTRRWTL